MNAASARAFDVDSPAGWSMREAPDYCSREGAMALKDKIEAYWRERGRHVMVSLQNGGFHPAIRAARYDLRTDMVNGLPRGAAATRNAPANDHGRAATVSDWSEDDDGDNADFWSPDPNESDRNRL